MAVKPLSHTMVYSPTQLTFTQIKFNRLHPSVHCPSKDQVLIRPALVWLHGAMAGVTGALHLTRDGGPVVGVLPVAQWVCFLQLGAKGNERVEERSFHGDECGFVVHGSLEHLEDSVGIVCIQPTLEVAPVQKHQILPVNPRLCSRKTLLQRLHSIRVEDDARVPRLHLGD